MTYLLHHSLSQVHFQLEVKWVHAGKCCRPHFTGCVYIFCTSSVLSGSNPLILTYRGDSNCTTYFADCLTAFKLGKTTCHRSLHCDSTHLFSVHICVVQVTWLRSVVFDRLVNGRFTVVADRVGSILRRVVIDRGCSRLRASRFNPFRGLPSGRSSTRYGRE